MGAVPHGTDGAPAGAASALATLSHRAKAAELGADAYVPEAFNVGDLLAMLQGLEEAS